jgi:hypothetical protein
MDYDIGTREQLHGDLGAAVAPDQPVRLLVIFRLGGFEEFTRLGTRSPGALIREVMSYLPDASGPSGFYYRPRRDELCGLIEGPLRDVERALLAASTALNERLGRKGLSLGFGAAVLPGEAGDPIGALALADSRVARVSDGEPMPRGSRGPEARGSETHSPEAENSEPDSLETDDSELLELEHQHSTGL